MASAPTNLFLFLCRAEDQVQDYILGKSSTTELHHQPFLAISKQGFDHYIFTYLESSKNKVNMGKIVIVSKIYTIGQKQNNEKVYFPLV